MSTFQFPNQKQLQQLNQGRNLGNVQMSYGVDISHEPGVIKNSHGMLNIFDEGDDAQFSSRLFAMSGGANTSTAFWAITDQYVFKNDDMDDPSSGWEQDASTNTPTLSNRSDMELFGGASPSLFVSGDSTGTIWVRTAGTATESWVNGWVTLKSKTALSTTYYTPMRRGPNNNLYILDAGLRVYYWPNDVNGTPQNSGNGTLDITYLNNYRIYTLEPASTRMWLGGWSAKDGTGNMIEWDMSENSTTPNAVYKMPSPVIAIPIWNDLPWPVCANGQIYQFTGSRFEPFMRFPVPENFIGFLGTGSTKFMFTPDNFTLMHPRGWAVIDGMIHFVINSQAVNATALTGSKQGYWKMPSGIWCLDPERGLYCRFPFDVDAGAGNSIGAQSVKSVGALFVPNLTTGKFLTGVDFYTDSAGTAKAALLLSDTGNTVATRSRIATNPFSGARRQVWDKIEMMHKKLANANDKIIVKYRLNKHASLPNYADVTWTSTTQFTSTSSTFANASVGDEIYVILGDGAGCSAHISSLSEVAGTYTANLDDNILGVANTETGSVRVDNWRKLATITNQQLDYHDFDIPVTTASRAIEFLFELRAAAGSVIEIDQCIITGNDV